MLLKTSLPLWLIIVPALAAGAELLLGRGNPSGAGRISVLAAAVTLAVALRLEWLVAEGHTLTAWSGQLYVDGLSALVVLIVAVVGLASTVFAYRYLRHDAAAGKTSAGRLPLYFALDCLFISTMIWAAVTNNLIMLYVVIEATTLASALLVTFYWRPGSLEAGYKYLLLCTVGISFSLLGCVFFYAAAAPYISGEKAMLITEMAKVAGHFPRNLALLGSALVIIGFGTKAGLIPFHAWLPDAHSQAPSPVSALLSGVTIKVAIYGIARLVTIFYPGYSAISLFVVLIGAITMLLGILAAFVQDDLKRMLAYSSVSQMGYIVMGLGVGSYLGFYGALYHLLNHALLKSMLFLCTGSLLYTGNTTQISRLQGKKHHTVTMICFFIGAFAVGGIPPLNGFWSKFAIFIATAQAGLWWATAVAVFTSLLTLACLVRAGYRIFLARDEHHEHAAAPHAGADHGRIPAGMWLTTTVMAGLCILIGLYPSLTYRLLDLASTSILYALTGGKV